MHDLLDLPQGLELALYWAGRGIRVFPFRYIPATDTHAAQKKPIFQTWQTQATTDEGTIRRWWSKWPDLWVGLATGGGSGLDVLDFDVKDGAPGKQTFDTLLEAGLIDGFLFDVDTPSGGWHRYFLGSSQRNGQIKGAGLDFRATGGFAVAPGNPGYQVSGVVVDTGDACGVDWQAIKTLLKPAPAADSTPTIAVPVVDPPAAPTRRLVAPAADRTWTIEQARTEITRWLAAVEQAKAGSINITLNDAAMRIGHFVPAFLDYGQAHAALASAVSKTVYDGQTWDARDTIKSGLTAGMREPYGVREDPPPTAPAAPIPNQRTAPGIQAPPAPAVLRQTTKEVALMSASRHQPRRAHWLWQDRIPIGEITLIAGREGCGKSTLLAWMARAITQGELPGEHYGHKRAVMYAAAEDSWEHTLVPRLLAAGADLDLVYEVVVQTQTGEQSRLVLPSDVDAVMQAGADAGAVALMLDPGLSFLDAGIDSFKGQELRPALEHLRRAAEQSGIAVPMLCHFNKSQGTDVLSKIAGSRAFAEVARAALAVAADVEDEEDGDGREQVVLSQVKNNLGRSRLPNLTFEIHDTAIPTDDGDAHVGRLVWTGQTDRDAEQILNGTTRKPQEMGDQVKAILAWVIGQDRAVGIQEIHDQFPQAKPGTTRKQLQRLVARGLLSSPMHAHYSPPRDILSPGGVSDGDIPRDGMSPRETPRSQTGTPRDKETARQGDIPPWEGVSGVSRLSPPSSRVDVSGGQERQETPRDGTRATRLRPPAPVDQSDHVGWLVAGDRPRR